MNIIQCFDCSPISCECDCKYKGIVFAFCNFYITSPSCCKIDKYDKSFNKIECIQTCRPYSKICFDCIKKCFWAISTKYPNYIYKLDCEFHEIDNIVVDIKDYKCVCLTGISCLDKCDLIVCGNFGIAKVSKTNCKSTIIKECLSNNSQYLAIDNTKCGIVTAYKKQDMHSVLWRNKECGEKIQCCIPSCYYIEDFAYCMCGTECILYILVSKNGCYPYILRCKLTSICDDKFCDICSCCSCFDSQICPSEKPDCCQSAAGIIESISLIEASLSHILNAEGEKIQKILGESDNHCEIMQVNEAVHKTIVSVTHLEQVLYEKLQTAKELCKNKCDKDIRKSAKSSNCNELAI